MAQLPFLYDAQLQEKDGTKVVSLSCSVWPAQSTTEATAGEAHDHTGEAPIRYAAELTGGANRKIVVLTGPMAGAYNIVEATPQPFTAHVGLELLRATPV